MDVPVAEVSSRDRAFEVGLPIVVGGSWFFWFRGNVAVVPLTIAGAVLGLLVARARPLPGGPSRDLRAGLLRGLAFSVMLAAGSAVSLTLNKAFVQWDWPLGPETVLPMVLGLGAVGAPLGLPEVVAAQRPRGRRELIAFSAAAAALALVLVAAAALQSYIAFRALSRTAPLDRLSAASEASELLENWRPFLVMATLQAAPFGVVTLVRLRAIDLRAQIALLSLSPIALSRVASLLMSTIGTDWSFEIGCYIRQWTWLFLVNGAAASLLAAPLLPLAARAGDLVAARWSLARQD